MMANKTARSLTKALGRRMAIANSGEAFTFSNANDLAAFSLYGYNGRSEVTSAARYWGKDGRQNCPPLPQPRRVGNQLPSLHRSLFMPIPLMVECQPPSPQLSPIRQS